MLVITDSISSDQALTQSQASALQAAGVYVFAIGVTAGGRNNEIRAITTQPQEENRNYFYVNSYRDLQSRAQNIASAICTTVPSGKFWCTGIMICWRHDMGTFSALPAFEENLPVIGGSPHKRLMTRDFYAFFDVRTPEQTIEQMAELIVI